MQNYIKELKFYSNNDFAFLEVHNKELFLKNALVLKEIVELFAPYKLTQNSTNQFLGNLFELFLQKGMKQDEGQFFTPMQICEFIMYSLPLDSMLKASKPLKVLDFACGAGHFLNTYANEIKRYITQDLKEHYKNIYGIEKEYRLSKVAKVSSAMYGQNEINILYADALATYELENPKTDKGSKQKPQIDNHSFDLLVANPPYSVKGFLETLSAKSKKTYSLFNDGISIETNNAIECFFIERAKQILKDNAKAAIILPSSILNKDSIYKSTREILFQNFDFIAIAELGSQTFGATGTNTIILFLRKKETFRQEESVVSQDYSLIKERLESENLQDNDDFYQNYLSAYCDFREFNKEHFLSFLEGNLNDEILKLDTFKEYLNAFKQTSEYKKLTESKAYRDSKDEDKISLERTHFIAYAQKIEKDKLLYFSLSLNQEVLIIKAPSDNKEQKRFLGYEWSNRKGDEGLKELHSPYRSPLFERDNPHNDSKLNTLIRKSFDNTLDSIPQELQTYATKARLIDMIDFEKVEFNKAISLNPKAQRQIIKSQYPLVKLKTCGDFFMGGTPSRKNPNYWNGDIKWLTIGDYTNHQIITDTKEKITTQGFQDSNVKIIQKGAVVVSIYATIGRVGILGEDMTTNQAIVSIIPNDEFINKYLMYAIDYFKFQLLNETITTSQKNINLGILQNMVIPKPPLEIQKQIVSECEKVEEQYNTIRMSIEEYQKLIKAILVKTGICEESANNGGGDNASSLDWQNIDTIIALILKELESLQSKLDFAFLESLACRIEYSEVSHQSIARSATESRPLRGAEIVDKGGATASARLELEAEERDTPPDCRKSGDFFGVKGSGEGINPFLRKEIFLNDNTESNKDTLLMQVMTEDLNTLLESLPTPPPHGWERKKLGELGKVCMCKRIMKHETNDKEGIPFYKIGTFGAKADCYISQETYENYKANYSYPKNGQILISAAGTIGKAVIYNGEPAYFQDSNIVWIDTDEKIVSNRFLFYTYQNIDWQSKSTRGGTILRLYNDNLRAIQIPLPPLEAQEKIVEVIENIESKIATIDSKISTLESQKAEILNNALVVGGGVTLKALENELKILYAQREALQNFITLALQKSGVIHKQSLQELLASLPTPPKEGYPQYRLNDKEKFSLQIGKRVLDSELNPQGQIPVFSANVKKPFGFIDKELLEDYESDSVLWGIDGDWLVGFVPKNTPFYPTDHCGILQVKDENIKAKIVSFVLDTAGKQAGFSRNLRASIERVGSLKIPIPPLEIQTKITQSIETIQSQISFLDSALPLLQSQKQEVLKKYLF